MKKLMISLLPALVMGCGTVVGNGKSGNDKAKQVNAGAPPDTYSPPSQNDKGPVPEGANAPGSGASPSLAPYFFVACASAFAVADEAGYAGDEGVLSITVDDEIRYIVGEMTATVTPKVTAETPYAIEAVAGLSPNVTCGNVATETVSEGTKVTVTYSDGVKGEWIMNADKLLNLKVILGNQSLEYTRATE